MYATFLRVFWFLCFTIFDRVHNEGDPYEILKRAEPESLGAEVQEVSRLNAISEKSPQPIQFSSTFLQGRPAGFFRSLKVPFKKKTTVKNDTKLALKSTTTHSPPRSH